MGEFSTGDFNKFIIANRVVGFFENEVTLKSGRKSHWYVNWRAVSNDVYLMDQLTDYLIGFVCDVDLRPDAFYGVPEGATKLGILTTYKWAKSSGDFAKGNFSLPMGRARPKEHGVPADRFFVGEPRGRVIVVEDVTTTGGSLIRELRNLKEAGVNVIAAIGLTNRMEVADGGKGVSDAIGAMGVPYHAMSDATSLLPELYRDLKPGERIARAIEDEFKKYGVKPLKLA